MTNQEIAAKVSQLINYNINKEGITCKELAARKKQQARQLIVFLMKLQFYFQKAIGMRILSR